MTEELRSRTVEVTCVGRPPIDRVARASGVSDVVAVGPVLRCRVTGSVQPFLEALHGAEVLGLTTDQPASTQSPAGCLGRPTERTTAMRPYPTNARVAGALFIAATAFSLIDSALLRPLLTAPDYLAAIRLDAGRVTAGAFFQVLAALACIGIAVALYPALRRHSEGLSLAAVALRTVEAVMYAVSALGALLLVALSTGGTADPSPTGDLLLALREHASGIGILAFYLGGSAYYVVMVRSRVVPRWLSGWGLASTTLGLIAGLGVFFGAITPFSPIQIACNLPIFLNELVLAGWLLTKGFAPDAALPHAAPLQPATTSR